MASPFDMMTAQQPAATTTLQAPPVLNQQALNSLGVSLSRRFTTYEQDRKLAELKWARNARQYLGIYDPEAVQAMDKNRSKAYPKITRVKCVSMLSRLMNLLFQASDKNWTVEPSAVPNLEAEDLQTVLDKLMPQQGAQQGMAGAPPEIPSDEQIEQAIREFAKTRSVRLESEIEDQLQDIGGSRMVNYVALCRMVLASGIQYGAGILKGPFVEEIAQRKWEQGADGRLQAVEYTAYRPRFEFVPIWDYYPDMSAKTRAQMEGQFQRIVMSKHQLSILKQRPDFFPDQIDAAMKAAPNGNYVRRAYETELRSNGVQINVSEAGRNKYEAIVWEGYVSGKELAATGVNVDDADLQNDVKAQIWMVGNTVIKAMIDPWSKLDTDGEMRQYHHFIFEEDETFLLGNGLPNIMRDSQMGVCAATRMTLDNGSIQRVFEVNTSLLSANQDLTAINPDKIFYRDDDQPTTMQYPAIRPIELPMKLAEFQGLVGMFQGFADQETFVGAATGGDMQKGPSEPFRTATGASMLRGDAALPFKDVVRNFDLFTESVIGALLNFNKNFNTNPAIRGDFQPVARGATSLIAKEVLGIQLDNFAQTLTDEEKKYVKMRNLVRERARARDMNVEDLVMDDAACDAVDQAAAQSQQAQQDLQNEVIRAEIRKTLAETMKNLTQASKNTASSEVATANLMLDAMERGINPAVMSQPTGVPDVTAPNPTAGQPQAGGGLAGPSQVVPTGAGDASAQALAGAETGQAGSSAAAMPAG